MNLKRFFYSISTTIILYIIISFIKWDLLFFLIIKDLEWSSRFLIVLFFILKEILTQLFYDINESKK